MKISINKNTLWCDLFVSRLAELGVKYACISPGSRSTSLALALAENKRIKIFPIVDERSSAFFALGLAKKSQSPVVVLTTSGTAVAELYPAIIESFYQRIPLIVCTADRPNFLKNAGANQTINQQNIYKNHIRLFLDAGLPAIIKINSIIDIAEEAVRTAYFTNRGPVHINLPFEKPFEPDNKTDKVDLKLIDSAFNRRNFSIKYNSSGNTGFVKNIAKYFEADKNVLLIVGYGEFNNDFYSHLINLAKSKNVLIYADGASGLRFGNFSKERIIENLTSLLRSEKFVELFKPDLIVQFGGAPTSNVVLDFLKNSKADKVAINEFGDPNDPSLTFQKAPSLQPNEFIHKLSLLLENKKSKISSLAKITLLLDKIITEKKKKYFSKDDSRFESKIVYDLIDILPERSNLMISNSMPIRDFDFFSSTSKKRIRIFTNRGASGIDGINSTALAIASISKEPTFLLTGDLSFYHDLNGLINAAKFNISLTVILINNSGGGIFESLPISKFREHFSDLFLTPLNINFKMIVEGYGGSFHKIKDCKELKRKVNSTNDKSFLSVFELMTDAKYSAEMRRSFWLMISKQIDLLINDIKS
jgi:2-succinyl-5-enolpyruvyl-6-hydroxy-3-cyclohexene-1-carboxylate synthase